MPRNFSVYVTNGHNTFTRFDLNSTATWVNLFWSFIRFSCNSNFFMFYCISPSSFLVHMVTARSKFGFKKETISHFVKMSEKNGLDVKQIFKKVEKHSKNWVLRAKYVTEAKTSVYSRNCAGNWLIKLIYFIILNPPVWYHSATPTKQ